MQVSPAPIRHRPLYSKDDGDQLTHLVKAGRPYTQLLSLAVMCYFVYIWTRWNSPLAASQICDVRSALATPVYALLTLHLKHVGCPPT